uniref:Probable acetate kinase n=1 Tax=Aureoumbra lagunensis TaxID=44058 RepID=A0A7S3JV20_9STRA
MWFEGGEVKAKEILSGKIEKIGGHSLLNVKGGQVIKKEAIEAPDHEAALDCIYTLLKERRMLDLVFVGHRVVHGGADFEGPALLDEKALSIIEKNIPLAPLHNPAALKGIRGAIKAFPELPQIAVFDTAFHMSIPQESHRYAVPKELYTQQGVRKYGFHGTSYGFVLDKVTRHAFEGHNSSSLILTHLGSGSSMCCVRNGKCLDTTMGLTPLEGLVMGTRSGDIDPGIVGYLSRVLKKTPAQVDAMLNKESGLLALSGISADMREIQAAALRGDDDAVFARKVFVERVRKYLGAYLIKLRGECEALIFTGGIGENDAQIRADVCAGLEGFGIDLDPVLNFSVAADKGKDFIRDISTPFSRTKVLIIHSSESEAIALQSANFLHVFEENMKQHQIQMKQAARHTIAAIASGTSRPDLVKLEPSQSNVKLEPIGRGIYMDGVGPISGEEIGLLYQVLPYAPKLGYFRPFADDDDRKLRTIRELFQLTDTPLQSMRGATPSEASEMLTQGREDELLDIVIEKYVEYAADKDFVLVSRGHLGQLGDVFWTAKVAAALSLPVVYVCHDQITPRGFYGGDQVTYHNNPQAYVSRVSEVAARVKEAVDSRGGKLAGVITTIPPGVPQDSVESMFDRVGVYPAAILPFDERFSHIAMSEIAYALNANVLLGRDLLSSQVAKGVVVATRYVPETLETLRNMEPGQLLVTHGERTDLLLAVVMAQQSPDFPPVAGIVLSGSFNGDVCYGSTEERAVGGDGNTSLRRALSILRRVPNAVRIPPVISVDASTYEAASAVHEMRPILLPSSHQKIEAAQILFECHLDSAFRQSLLATVTSEAQSASTEPRRKEAFVTTPKLFQHRLFSKARSQKMTIVLPEGDDRRVVAAAGELVERALCKVVLLGDREAIRRLAIETRVDSALFPVLASTTDPLFEIYDPQADTELRAKMVDGLFNARKHKGVTYDGALTLLREDPNYYGTMLLQLGLADGMVSGACHSTAATMRPPLQIIKMKSGVSIVSSIFFMLLQDGVKIFGDCAININPSADELATIACASAETARAFGLEPRVALLSYATGDSNTGALIDKVRDATTKAREMLPNELFEGPIQFDAAVDPAVALVKFKGKENSVAGKANVCIFPSLDSGNSAYKAVQQASKCVAVGPIMQGMRKPVNDLSRGCTINDIVNTVVVTAVQAQALEAEEAASS